MPPIHSSRTPPEIPEKFRLFGLEYKTVNGSPHLDMPAKPLDKEHLRKCVDESIQLFLKTIRTLNGSMLNQIRDLHIHMNEEINMAKAFEGFDIIQECKNNKIKAKATVLDKMRKITE